MIINYRNHIKKFKVVTSLLHIFAPEKTTGLIIIQKNFQRMRPLAVALRLLKSRGGVVESDCSSELDTSISKKSKRKNGNKGQSIAPAISVADVPSNSSIVTNLPQAGLTN